MTRRGWLTTAGVAVAGLLAGGVIAAVSPAIGAPGPGPGTGPAGAGPSAGPQYRGGGGPGAGMSPGAGMGARAGNRGNGPGPGAGAGTCPCLNSTAPSGTLTDAQKSTLQAMAEEEKLAHDLYAAFADKYGTRIFTNISRAETQHLTAIRNLLKRYGLTDPTAGKAAGAFSSASVQSSYDKLLAQGSASQNAALVVGRTVEQADIAELTRALSGLSAPDVTQAYEHLKTASQQHLKAFEAWLK